MQILEPFVAETLASLSTLAQLEASAGAPFEAPVDRFRFRGCAVATHVSGAIPGKILLHFYPESLDQIGARIFSRLTGATGLIGSGECQEALAEWANVLIGRSTRALEMADLGVRFTSPFFVESFPQIETLLRDVVEIISLPIETARAGRFYFNYLLHDKTETLDASA
jgi:CheY-specific phosphatase CheX